MEEYITDPKELTPVQIVNGIYVKREDLFAPFGIGDVNGGKLRQCWLLVEPIKDKYNGVITCCSIYSPQGPISSAVAEHFGLTCDLYYGATSEEKISTLPMPQLARKHNAVISIHPKHFRHINLYSLARKNAEVENKFIIEYGFNLDNNPDAILGAVSNQVQNIPDELDALIVTCGSGITSRGILIGIKKFNKRIKKVYFVATAPSRQKSIDQTISEFNIDIEYEIIDLFHRPGFVYEQEKHAKLGDIILHPNYEAKSYLWYVNESNLMNKDKKVLFWIVGSKPTLR